MQAWTAYPRDTVPGGLAEIQDTMRFDGDVLMDWGVDVLSSTGAETTLTVPVNYDAGGAVRWGYRVPDRVSGGDMDAAATRRTASLTVTGDVAGINFYANYFRIWTQYLSRQSNWIRWYHGVFCTTDPGLVDDGILLSSDLDLADKSFLWNQKRDEESAYFDIGTDVLDTVVSELSSIFGETVVNVPGDAALLTQPIIIDGDVSYAERWRKLLEAKGYDAVIADELGVPTIRLLSTLSTIGPEETFGPTNLSSTYKRIIIPGQREPLLPSTPNKLRFVARQGPPLPSDGNGYRIKTNQSTGPASIDQRGGREVFQRIDVEATEQSVLDAVATADAQRYFAGGGIRFKGQVAVNPRFGDQDVIEVIHPRLGISGVSLVTDWQLPLKRVTSPDAVLMPITCEQRVVVT